MTHVLDLSSFIHNSSYIDLKCLNGKTQEGSVWPKLWSVVNCVLNMSLSVQLINDRTLSETTFI